MTPSSTAPPSDETAASERIAALEQQLARTQRLAALGELVSTTTHEFNNVLMTILNYARMGLRHKDEPTRDKALDKILTAAQRASKITSTILAVARNRSGNFEPTNLKKIGKAGLHSVFGIREGGLRSLFGDTGRGLRDRFKRTDG